MVDNISDYKKALRAEARARRKAFVAQCAPASWTMGSFDLDMEISAGTTVASYQPIGSEADPADAERCAYTQGAIGCYPRIDADGEMRFYAYGPYGSWRAVPSENGERSGQTFCVAPGIIFLPLLAFDRCGTRLGQGGGHYDRALANLPSPLKIGIAWSVQEMADLPREPWDIPLDFVITEKEWIVTS